MKKKILVVVAMVMVVMAIGTGCSNPVTSTISYESESTNMIFENPQTGEREFIDLKD